ncbi:hypothetical protein KC865_04570 [Candidatus Kaiserbacteria bacterium]|nr:hypothetical protein [Candidatus Kaiserbacteria bacterium]USN92173.1 MAG: hypothetical protein H6782_04850 [Candidatus Nomurabacteria bacterium]
MNTVKILSIAVASLVFLPLPASASLEVTFEESPLFVNTEILPGDSVSRTVVVRNTNEQTELVQVGASDVFSDGLSSVMSLEIAESNNVIFSDTFANFFNNLPVDLGQLSEGEQKTYYFTASLPSGSENVWQEKTMGFDLIIGFKGGETVSNRQGSSQSGTRITDPLRLFNEQALVNLGEGDVNVTWNSNRDSSSYLVCGRLEGDSFSLSPEEPFFGYDFFLPEELTDDVSHSMILTGLSAGRYECRPAGRRNQSDSFTVGEAVRFGIPSGEVAGVSATNFTFIDNQQPAFSQSGFGSLGMVKGESTSSDESSTTTPENPIGERGDVDTEKTLPAPFSSNGVCSILWPLILSIGVLLRVFYKDFKSSVSSEQYRHGRLMVFIWTLFVLAGIWIYLISSVGAGLVFFAVWLVSVLVDQLARRKHPGWLPRKEALYLMIFPIIPMLVSLLTPYICHPLPYLIVTVFGLMYLYTTYTNSKI